MLYGLCESIARLAVSLKKGPFREPVYLVGGVAANAAIRRALTEAVSLRNGKETIITVPHNFLHVQALGTALLARVGGKPLRVMLGRGRPQRIL